MLQLPPLSLYLHVPWCVRKCPYCDFNSHAVGAGADLPEAAYLRAMEEEFQQSVAEAQGRKIQTLFFGGGTPSLVSADFIVRSIALAERYIGLAADVEITLEANPGTFEQARFSDFRRAGVNRLSIGVQSFDAEHLQRLGRIHSVEEASNAVDIARKAGFDNINLDLMYGLPGQTNTQALGDLSRAFALAPEHLSWYELTIEPNTEFYRYPPQTPDDEQMADMTEAGLSALAAEGYARYEVSAYARGERRCRHNLNYWQFGDYLGIGAGAHEKITWPQQGRIVRRAKTRMPEHYQNRIGSRIASEHEIPDTERLFDFMMNALRLSEGVPLSMVQQRAGIAPAVLNARMANVVQRGLVELNEHRIKPSEQGLRYLNLLLESLL